MTLVWRNKPFTEQPVVTTDVYAEHLLLDAVRRRREPYVAFVVQVAPQLHWFFLARKDYVERVGAR
jgi:hypothetical protein